MATVSKYEWHAPVSGFGLEFRPNLKLHIGAEQRLPSRFNCDYYSHTQTTSNPNAWGR